MAYTKEQMNIYMKERWIRRKQLAITQLGGKCVTCGSTETLQFDHIDPISKYKNISKLSSASEELFQIEIAKCQLLCLKCHKIKHASKHGSLGMYSNNSCRCDKCKDIWNRYHNY